MRVVVPLPGMATGVREAGPVLKSWSAAPGPVVVPWVAASALIAAGLLLAVWAIALGSTPDATPILFPGLHTEPSGAVMLDVLARNGVVLGFHALACVAGYLAGYSMPREAGAYDGWVRRLHDVAQPVAFAFVAGATLFSLFTQATILGGSLSTLAAQLELSKGLLLVGLLPHAIPELVAVFLPLGAWMVAARAQAWRELFAATIVTVLMAVPILLAAATVEVWVSPRVIQALQFV